MFKKEFEMFAASKIISMYTSAGKQAPNLIDNEDGTLQFDDKEVQAGYKRVLLGAKMFEEFLIKTMGN